MCVNETEWPYICAEMPLRNTHQLTPLVVDKEGATLQLSVTAQIKSLFCHGAIADFGDATTEYPGYGYW